MTDTETSRRKLTATTLGGVLVLIVCLGIVGYGITKIRETGQENMARGEQIEAIGAQNRATTCSIARLVSYVPALQFEGEPQSNFVNWILARKALLSEVQEANGCSDAVEAVLAERVRLDQRVLDELEKKP